MRRHLATVYGLGIEAGAMFLIGNTPSSVSILRRRSSMMRRTSDSFSTTRGVMNITSSVLLFLSSCEPKSPPRIGIRASSGSPLYEFSLSSRIRPPITIVCPDGTASSVWIERVLIGGESHGVVVVPAMLTYA